MRSVIPQEEGRCYLCGSMRWLEEHHVFGGPDRKTSERYGLKVTLCHFCHNEPPNGVHQNKERRRWLQRKVQKFAMKYYGWSVEGFRDRFGKNYL